MDWKIAAFVFVSIGITWLSRQPLRSPKSHGFYRYFAWELILALVLLNLDVWFADPFRWHQLISWTLLLFSLYLIVHAVLTFRRRGQHGARDEQPDLIGIEKTTRLVTEGPYRWIRHPFYSSLLFLALGVFYKKPSWLGGLLAGLAVVCLVITAKIEERENTAFFGEEYVRYMGETKMFVPYVF